MVKFQSMGTKMKPLRSSREGKWSYPGPGMTATLLGTGDSQAAPLAWVHSCSQLGAALSQAADQVWGRRKRSPSVSGEPTPTSFLWESVGVLTQKEWIEKRKTWVQEAGRVQNTSEGSAAGLLRVILTSLHSAERGRGGVSWTD